MTTIRSRGEIIGQTEGVSLLVSFYNLSGDLADPITFPSITITQPSGNVILGPTSVGVYKQSTGVYGYDYITGLNSSLGVYTDKWQASIAGIGIITKEYNFIVDNTQLPMINSDGYVALGDDPGFHYSQTAIQNINKILKGVKARLRSAGKTSSTDRFGNPIYSDCDIFSVEVLVSFIAESLSLFNEYPHFTFFTFEDTPIIDQFFNVFVQGAVLQALSSQALLERGLEYQLSDNGINFTPPTLSELLNTEWSAELNNYTEKVKAIKLSMKPAPLGLGTLWAGNISRSPTLSRLRHLRARQII